MSKKISQISVVYLESPIVVVNFIETVDNGVTTEQIGFEELISYINRAEAQAFDDGTSVNFSKGGYLYNNNVYPAIVMAVQSLPDPPITEYRKKTFTVANLTAATPLALVPFCGAYRVNEVFILGANTSYTNREFTYFKSNSFADTLDRPYMYIFEAGPAGLPDALNPTGPQNIKYFLQLNGNPVTPIYVIETGRAFRFTALEWSSAWDTICFMDSATQNSYAVRLANTAGGCCAAPVVNVYSATTPIAPGATLYYDPALTAPVAETFVMLPDFIVYPLAVGVIGAATATVCAGSFAEISNVVVGAVRTQKAQIGATVIPGSTYNCEVYSHKVSYTAQAGDTRVSVMSNLINAINATSIPDWNDHNTAPAVGTQGFPPFASSQGFDTIVIQLNASNQFAFYIS